MTPQKKLTRIDQLKEWDRNPREIDEKALAGLKISIEEFGDLSGITYNVRLGALVAGHQRLRALREKYGAGLKIQDDRIVSPDGFCRFAIRYVDWDEQKHAAANIAANNQYIAGSFTDSLVALMDQIEAQSPELMQTLNFDRLKIEFDAFWKSQQLTEDVAPPLPKKPRTKPGDLYELGPHRLVCGDVTVWRDIARLMGKEKAHLVFTDPPYNVDYESESGSTYASLKFGGTGKIFNDDKKPEECLAFYEAALTHIHEVTTPDVTLYWWYASKNAVINEQALQAAGWRICQHIIWLKNSFIFSHTDYHRCYEPCIVGWKEGKKHFSTKMFNNLTDVFSVDYADFQEQLEVWYERRDITNYYVHPTQKPVRLAERALKKNSRVGDIVLDVFAGSGSTLIGCHQLGRKCYASEIDPKYADVIVTRYVKFTGAEYVKLNGKKTKWEVE